LPLSTPKATLKPSVLFSACPVWDAALWAWSKNEVQSQIVPRGWREPSSCSPAWGRGDRCRRQQFQCFWRFQWPVQKRLELGRGWSSRLRGAARVAHLRERWLDRGKLTRTSFLDAVTGGATGIELPGQRREGWFLGGGTEYAFNFLPGLFLKSEYRFADFGNRNSDLICDGIGTCGAAGPVGALDRSPVFVQTITTELVYRFNWSGVGGGRY
jgi:hypothetical protein